MEKPDLNRMWETFIKIPTENQTIIFSDIYDNIRLKICPIIERLRENGLIRWYCFLIHNRHSGVPTSENDDSPYFHIRFELLKKSNPDDFLPKYCTMTRKIKPEKIQSILGLDKTIIKNEQIEEAWRIIGEQSEWVIKMLNIHKKGVKIPPKQIGQFLHYFANMTCVSVK